jgi:ABC-type lipoprotein export system ATPase subunit
MSTSYCLPTDAVSARFFASYRLPQPRMNTTIEEYWDSLPWQTRELSGWTLEGLEDGISCFLTSHEKLGCDELKVQSLEVVGGRGKDGRAELQRLLFHSGEVVTLVGPTGAGKSRFLADIECMAQGDTPSGRYVRINGNMPDMDLRFSAEQRPVAHISQNMNFVMDLPVGEFLQMHAESRSKEPSAVVVQRVLEAAIGMAGEPFQDSTPLTQLSGGQSRALMIADAALLSPKPIILIDEIENAGVNRAYALELLVRKGKIVILSTHDPMLALAGSRRLVIANGIVTKVMEATSTERGYSQRLEQLDRSLACLREALRQGLPLEPLWNNLQL